jgi:chromosome segregation ATPase
MNIQKNLIDQLIDLSEKYSRIHSEVSSLETELVAISIKRESLSEQLNYYRSLEKELINKIEEQTGEKITADILREILK